MKLEFSEEEHTRIREAVSTAEKRTSGEIVAYVMERSDYYTGAFTAAALLFGLIGLLIGFTMLSLYTGWGYGWLDTPWGIVALGLAFGLVGIVAVALVPPVKRFFIGRSRLHRSVRLQAHRAFVEEEVFHTRDRTGILLFVSVFEHRVEVLADEGINRAVEQGEWQDVVDRIILGIRTQTLTTGLVDAIQKCGELLNKHGVEIKPDDSNELSDDVRIRRDL